MASNIVSVIEVGEELTYDLEVDHPDHQFYLSNGMLTSNSHSYSYAIDSFMCAYLETYHEAEWLCSYLESQMGNADARGTAIATVKSFGYDIGKVDINLSTDRWVIAPDGKTLVPPLLSVKGVGMSAVEEIIANRPYHTVEDLCWDANGKWRHSKFNKKSMENLIMVGAFGSMDIVGVERQNKLVHCHGCEVQNHERKSGQHCQGCEVQDHTLPEDAVGKKIRFRNWRHMHAILIDNQELLRKKFGPELLPRLVPELSDVEEWSNAERGAFHRELIGDLNVDFILDPTVQARLTERDVHSVDDMQEGTKAIAWFVLVETKHLVTKKNSRHYVMAIVAGPSGTTHRINIWGAGPDVNLQLNTAYIAELERNDYGLSTRINQVRRLGS